MMPDALPAAAGSSAMKVHYESGGGVTGPAGRRSCVVESHELPVNLIAMAAAIGRGEYDSPPTQSDRPDESYVELTVEDGDRRRTLSVSRRKLAAELRPLVHWLEQRSAGS